MQTLFSSGKERKIERQKKRTWGKDIKRYSEKEEKIMTKNVMNTPRGKPKQFLTVCAHSE